MILRPYQVDIAHEATVKLISLGIVYICAEVRTGKTLMALQAAHIGNYKKVLFLTKLKAISSIEQDYASLNYPFHLTVINNESLHKITDNDFDLLIIDEAHRIGAFPKPNNMCKDIRMRFHHLPMILLSGTPTPESYSQIFHQFWVSDRSPFSLYRNFYIWAKTYTNPAVKYLGHYTVNDYSKAKQELITPIIDPYFIRFTQVDAGFTSEVTEHILRCPMRPTTYNLAKRLLKDKVIEGQTGVILGDTGVKLMNKLHQIYSGSVILESGEAVTLDMSKIECIYNKFHSDKIAIFYKFKQEYEIIKNFYKDSVTQDIDEFNNSDKIIALQIQSGREGINLSKAKYIVYYNIDFSALSYWQSRARTQSMDRLVTEVFWVFSEGGIEERIYQTVLKKKDYTLSQFNKDYEIRSI